MPTQLLLKQADLTSAQREIQKAVQGDVLIGLQKKAELFYFFRIDDSAGFKSGLSAMIPEIATTDQVRSYERAVNRLKAWQDDPAAEGSRPHPPAMVTKTNIALSAAGLTALGVPLGGADKSFLAGMEAGAGVLGDTPAGWIEAYRGQKIHGVVLVAEWNPDADKAVALAQAALTKVVGMFGSAITEVAVETGKLNPAAPGHEMFGFADGVSQPAVDGVHRPVTAEDQSYPGQDIVALGDFILGDYEMESGDKATPPQEWMENGSYMVFRRLRQDVDGFHNYTRHHHAGLADDAEQFAARLIGRWPDGSPLARNPLRPSALNDEDQPFQNNDFEFGVQKVGQDRCPFNAHIRRVYPRSDIQGGSGNAEARRILRAGIAYDQSPPGGDDRGLLFVCYQSSIADKFEFIQGSWANATGIPFDPPMTSPPMPNDPGVDLIIGQTSGARGGDWGNGRTFTNVPQFVTATGGEYFFMPSIGGLEAIAAF